MPSSFSRTDRLTAIAWPLAGLAAGALLIESGSPAVLATALAVLITMVPMWVPDYRRAGIPEAGGPDDVSPKPGSLLESLTLAAALRKPDGTLVEFNRHYRKWQNAFEARLISDDEARLREQREDAEALRGTNTDREVFCQHPDTGNPSFFRISKRRCSDAEGNPLILITVADLSAERNMTHRLQSALAHQLELVQNTNQFVQRLIDVIPEPVYVKDDKGHYIMINEAFAKQRDQRSEDIVWRTARDLAHNRNAAMVVSDEDLSVLAGASIYKEDMAPHPITGEPRYRIVTKGTCTNAEGQRVIVGANFDITERRRFEQQLESNLENEQARHRRTQEFVQRIMDLVPFPLYVKDAQSRFVMVNEAMARDKCMSKEELIAHMGLQDHASPEELYQHFEEDGAVLAGMKVYKEVHKRHEYTGRETWSIVSKDCCLDPEGNQVIVGAQIDLSELRLAERTVQQSLAREVQLRERTLEFTQRLLDVIPDPVYIKKAGGRYVMVNDAFARYHDHPREEILNAPEIDLSQASDVKLQSLTEDRMVLDGQELTKEEHTTRKATGEEVFRVVTKRRSVYFDGEPVVIGIDHHITNWRLAERELMRMAGEDALTGMANRRRLRDEAERSISLAHRHGHTLAVLIFDLDHFKHVNDRYGHQAGDEVLIEIGKRTRAALRRDDLPARWGGEEFVVLLPQTDIKEAWAVAERLRLSVAGQAIHTSAGKIDITLSGGLAQLLPSEAMDQLIARADSALYGAKESGRNKVHLAAVPSATAAAA